MNKTNKIIIVSKDPEESAHRISKNLIADVITSTYHILYAYDHELSIKNKYLSWIKEDRSNFEWMNNYYSYLCVKYRTLFKKKSCCELMRPVRFFLDKDWSRLKVPISNDSDLFDEKESLIQRFLIKIKDLF